MTKHIEEIEQKILDLVREAIGEMYPTEITAVLRLDSNCTEAPTDDPLTIDIYDENDKYEKILHSLSVGELIKEMIKSRSIDDQLNEDFEAVSRIREELCRLVDVIDEATPPDTEAEE